MYVTHDQVEAMTMGDRVAVLRDGWLQQVDTPQRLYDEPANVFVASFIGSPSMNLYEARIDGDEVVLGPHRLRIPASVRDARPGLKAFEGREVVLGMRPEDLGDASLAADVPPGTVFAADVELTESLGSEIIVHFALDAPRVDPGNPDVDLEADVVAVSAVARFSPRSTCAAGQSFAQTY